MSPAWSISKSWFGTIGITRFTRETFVPNGQMPPVLNVASISEYCHVLGQPSTMILSSIELLRMPGIDEATRKMAADMCYDAALEIKRILGEMKHKCDQAEDASAS